MSSRVLQDGSGAHDLATVVSIRPAIRLNRATGEKLGPFAELTFVSGTRVVTKTAFAAAVTAWQAAQGSTTTTTTTTEPKPA